MYLLDTNVISELRKPQADSNVQAWARSVAAPSLYVSAITILELETGVLRFERKDPSQGGHLRAWLDNHVLPAFAGRILAVDRAVALRCARLHVPDRSNECDALIAATALIHGLTVVTRNVADFEASGVTLLNPWVA
ncbi:PIN domain-containing protein [Pseudomonas mediterranea]|jgi:predicted nucleic acid-binding protein|uniref:Ribonuclease VapC n=1 Tax=Pseudomonas mediterranea TaxID=183795 RepID=A0AAX2DGJ3_9PSED|nr:type II toxin-antitoxin system VapC family toxin [Pseudomonas mediterranea]KGU82181.1 twitching motility protein PilT [Pseudomonas mediterranea CFBP 5447]MBL0843241.1 type II toxin-antitoxin system VapC family toxin [Pseudomonas mediterranea]QHA81846.1 PIN domain-containing protein [Pseudomonas mediterranea]UZE02783.1 type II toxin-antitoxin system VapC family toxin [Pseudomonas mediterranea]CAH0186223.1 Toxin FitB [Pseudomonas mediterranea]